MYTELTACLFGSPGFSFKLPCLLTEFRSLQLKDSDPHSLLPSAPRHCPHSMPCLSSKPAGIFPSHQSLLTLQISNSSASYLRTQIERAHVFGSGLSGKSPYFQVSRPGTIITSAKPFTEAPILSVPLNT